MTKFKKILFLLTLIACVPLASVDESVNLSFFADLRLSLLDTEEFILGEGLERQTTYHLTEPPFAWRVLLSTSKICLWQRALVNENASGLRLTSGPCTDDYESKMISEATNLVALKASFDRELRFRYRELEQEKVQSIPLLNLSKIILSSGEVFNLVDRKEKFSSMVDTRSGSGLRVYGESPNKLPEQHLLGTLSDSYLEKTAVRCHQVNTDCEDVKANECESCRYGYYEVVDHLCPQGGSKFCAPNKCGLKGEPACLRGIKHIQQEISTLCFADSPAGFCEEGLVPHCDENQILICL